MAQPLRKFEPQPTTGEQPKRRLSAVPSGAPIAEAPISPTASTSAISEDEQIFNRRNSEFARQAYRTLHVGFTVVPLIAGVDKFFHVLTNWDQYMSPIAARILGVYSHSFMLLAGVIEIIAGIGVALKPRIFSPIVCAWLLGITINLITTGIYYDIALRDFGLAIGALALYRLSRTSHPRTSSTPFMET